VRCKVSCSSGSSTSSEVTVHPVLEYDGLPPARGVLCTAPLALCGKGTDREQALDISLIATSAIKCLFYLSLIDRHAIFSARDRGLSRVMTGSPCSSITHSLVDESEELLSFFRSVVVVLVDFL